MQDCVAGEVELETEDEEDDNQESVYDMLYDGSPVRENESIQLISMYATRHRLTDVALQDLLKLLEIHCPKPNKCATSLHKYKRLRKRLTSDIFQCVP